MTKKYRVTKGISTKTSRFEPGAIVDESQLSAVKWLLEVGAVEEIVDAAPKKRKG